VFDAVRAEAARAPGGFRVVERSGSLDVAFGGGDGVPASRCRLKIFRPRENRNRVCVFFYKRSNLVWSRDRFSYGAIELRPESMTQDAAATWLAWLRRGFHPDERPARLRRAFLYTIPDDEPPPAAPAFPAEIAPRAAPIDPPASHRVPLPAPMRRFEVAAGILWNGAEVLITRRHDHDHQGGRWEFPGGKRHAGETIEGCLRRELLEEIGVSVTVGTLWRALTHLYPDRSVSLYFHFCTNPSGEPRALDVAEWRWAAPEELAALRFVDGDGPILPDLIRDLAALRA
jgi:8-oxo-dGTP diphosphatase